jgi:hypothetical protein
MTIRPIIFSQDMVRALLDGRKTQTRRLATSPLRKCEPGDLLYVREAFTFTQHNLAVYRADARDQRGNRWSSIQPGDPQREVKWRPSIHMPRWASRLTLRVTDVRFQPVKALTTEEAYAEGAIDDEWIQWREDVLCIAPAGSYIQNERDRFGWLWDSLHPVDGKRWDDNPDIVALTFEVIRGNVDQLAPTGGMKA